MKLGSDRGRRRREDALRAVEKGGPPGSRIWFRREEAFKGEKCLVLKPF